MALIRQGCSPLRRTITRRRSGDILRSVPLCRPFANVTRWRLVKCNVHRTSDDAQELEHTPNEQPEPRQDGGDQHRDRGAESSIKQARFELAHCRSNQGKNRGGGTSAPPLSPPRRSAYAKLPTGSSIRGGTGTAHRGLGSRPSRRPVLRAGTTYRISEFRMCSAS
jgi:hypothetical protein